MFPFKKLIKSFTYAFNGMRQAWQWEKNIKIHVVAAIVAIVIGWKLKISTQEWAIVLLCIGTVISLEIVNTVIEKLCDFVAPQYHTQIKTIKDLAAGAVLVMVILSAVVALVLFLPKIVQL